METEQIDKDMKLFLSRRREVDPADGIGCRIQPGRLDPVRFDPVTVLMYLDIDQSVTVSL